MTALAVSQDTTIRVLKLHCDGGGDGVKDAMTRRRCCGKEVVTTCPPWRDTESLLSVPFSAHIEMEKACAVWCYMRFAPDGRCLQYLRRAGFLGVDRRMIYLRPFDKQTKQNAVGHDLLESTINASINSAIYSTRRILLRQPMAINSNPSVHSTDDNYCWNKTLPMITHRAGANSLVELLPSRAREFLLPQFSSAYTRRPPHR